MARVSGPDTIRILVATDNHVGYGERDPIRKDDSWKTFDEIMNLARTEDVDMVLLGGDLFHDNKPSRKAMYQVLRSLRQNCLGMKPCELEMLSDAAEIFEGAYGHVNYEDPDINVAIPVFSIHGNHDDPSGDGHYCSLDLLQVAGLINYFGRVPEADNIKVKPVLLQKGATKLALYGTGNVRDERMFRTFRDHKVTFFRPGEQAADFFNLMVVHQNHHARTATSYLPENFLPDWLDLVVWGHEHECLIDPTKNAETGFYVMQPGSSVATSLVPGEAVPKHVALVHVTGKDFTVDKIPLKTVRPFVTRDLVLAQDRQFKDLAKKRDNRAELTRRLVAVVDEMIEQANDEYRAIHSGADRSSGGGSMDDEDNEPPPLPLIRLKVEYTAPEGGNFDCENPQRFSNRFAGRVANVNDVVFFHRKKTTALSNAKPALDLPEGLAEQADNEFSTIKVEALVNQYLAAQSLKILPQGEFGDAVNQFVKKDDKHAMDAFVSGSLATQLKDLLALGAEDEELDSAIERIRMERERQFQAGLARTEHRRRYKPKPDDWDSDMEGHWENNPAALLQEPAEAAASVPPPPGRAGTRTAMPGRGGAVRAAARPRPTGEDEDLSMDDFDDLTPIPKATTSTTRRTTTTKTTATATAGRRAAPKKAAPARRTAASGRKKGPFEDSESDEDDAIMLDDDDDDEIEEDEIEDDIPPPPPAAKSRARAPAAARSSRTTAVKAPPKPTGGRSRQTTLPFASQSQTTPAPAAASRARAPARGAAKAKAAAKQVLELSADEISDGDDDFEPAPRARAGRR